MAIEIKELVIQGKMKDDSNQHQSFNHDTVQEVNNQLVSNNYLTNLERQELIDECVAVVLKELENVLKH
ncbi:DUF5908 family protein [Psychroflexus planctonicus]|nr:DUF5908 family protein [Psychroflexus planctonicus]